MAQIILKGFKFINGTVGGFDPSTLEKDYINLVRTSADYTEGYIYFNGKKYGNLEKLQRDLTSLSGATQGIEVRLDTVIGADEGKSAREITQEEILKLIADAPESFDTLKEVADWIEGHSGETVNIITELENLKEKVENMELNSLQDVKGDEYIGAFKEGGVVTLSTNVVTDFNGGDMAGKLADAQGIKYYVDTIPIDGGTF